MEQAIITNVVDDKLTIMDVMSISSVDSRVSVSMAPIKGQDKHKRIIVSVCGFMKNKHSTLLDETIDFNMDKKSVLSVIEYLQEVVKTL